MGNIFTSYVIKGELKASTVKGGIETMIFLTEWYRANSGGKGVGFFQIAGGISGDFPICVVPMMYQDLEWEDVPFWAYFCQISDSTTSYGSYSGAVPNEKKITWGKLAPDTPKFIVESDATIVAPLIFRIRAGLVIPRAIDFTKRPEPAGNTQKPGDIVNTVSRLCRRIFPLCSIIRYQSSSPDNNQRSASLPV